MASLMDAFNVSWWLLKSRKEEVSHLFKISISLDRYSDDPRCLGDVELWPCECDD